MKFLRYFTSAILVGLLCWCASTHVVARPLDVARMLMQTKTASGGSTPAPTPSFGRWKFNDGTGVTASDAVGSNAGTLANGPTWITGGFGNGALQMNGGTFETVVWNPGIGNQTTASFTVNIWIKYTGTGNAFCEIVGTSVTSGFHAGWYFIIHSDQRVYFDINDGSNDANGYSGTLPLLNDGSWHMITGVVDRTSNTLSEYIDGVLKTSASTSAVGSLTSSGQMQISGIPTSTFTGAVDDFSLDQSSTAWTSAQIAALFSAGAK